jgi:hypothetical protein
MNLIVYRKNAAADREILEYLKSKTGMDVYAAHNKPEVIKLFDELPNVHKLILMNIAIPSDMGLIKFVTENYPETKIIVYAGSLVKESIEIIRNSKITLIDDSIDNMRNIHKLVIDSTDAN